LRRRKIPVPPTGQLVDAVELSFQNVREHWNEYLLDDGTILKLKPVATEVFKVENQFDQEGNPVYVLRSKNIIVVSAPENLRRTSEKEGGAQG
jgi:hypothetical protein